MTDLQIPPMEELQDADATHGIVHIITGRDANGEPFYAYVSVKPSRYEEFLLITRAGEEMDLAEFGRILSAGFGEEPPNDVRARMEEKYGVDHNFLANLQKDIAQRGERA